KYPDRIPIICDKVQGNSIPNIAKQTYLIPSDLCLGQFIYAIQKKIRLSEKKVIYIIINGSLPTVAGL
ncbi:microtubule associated protein, partial [Parasitella parasitica]